MKVIIVLACLLGLGLGKHCLPYNGSLVSAENINFTTAAPIAKEDLPKILQIYGNLTTLGEYKISLQYGIYAYVDSLCNKGTN